MKDIDDEERIEL